jgi:hypothetical protein
MGSGQLRRGSSGRDRLPATGLINLLLTIANVIILYFTYQVYRDAGSPNVSVSRVDSYYTREQIRKVPCIAVVATGQEIATWQVNFIAIVDVTNLGGRAISLTRIGSDTSSVDRQDGRVTLLTSYSTMADESALKNWLREHEYVSSLPDEMGAQNYYLSGLPVTIGPGEVKRIILGVSQKGEMSSSMAPSEVKVVLGNSDLHASANFGFADGKTVQLSIPHLELEVFDQANPSAWVSCTRSSS